MLTRAGVARRPTFSSAEALAPLPRGFVRAVFLLLPVDTRLFCSEVSRAWRVLLADKTLFARLDLSTSSGLKYFSWPLLCAAVAKAGGQLRTLNLTGQLFWGKGDHLQLLREIVTANAATLTELRMGTRDCLSANQIRYLLRAAPGLSLLETFVFVWDDYEVLRAMLRNEPPFQALRLRRLDIVFRGVGNEELLILCSALRRHASLEEMLVQGVVLETAASMGAFVDALIALRLRGLEFFACRIAPVALPELTRLVSAGALRELDVASDGVRPFDEWTGFTQLFCAAVRASAMTRLQLDDYSTQPGIFPEVIVETAALVNARPN